MPFSSSRMLACFFSARMSSAIFCMARRRSLLDCPPEPLGGWTAISFPNSPASKKRHQEDTEDSGMRRDGCFLWPSTEPSPSVQPRLNPFFLKMLLSGFHTATRNATDASGPVVFPGREHPMASGSDREGLNGCLS
eukprot:NP_001230194.1 uncharacterized protein LOC330951 [Mus musculus]